LDVHSPAAPHAHISLTIDATLDDRFVIPAIDATLHDDRCVVVIRLVAAIVRLRLIAIAAAIVRLLIAVAAAIVRASADLHAESGAAKAELSVGRSRDE
jgi:hypothetical protein